MVLAGLGVAVGAVIGALLPTTEIEERYVGPAAGSLKEQAKDAAREQWERGKQMAAEGWDEAKDAARRSTTWTGTPRRPAQEQGQDHRPPVAPPARRAG